MLQKIRFQFAILSSALAVNLCCIDSFASNLSAPTNLTIGGSPIIEVDPSPPPARDLPAFPGAMGFGASTRGAFGGPVAPIIYRVTNLNDSGPGSLRHGLTAAEYRGKPRVVIFDTGGTIELGRAINVLNDSFITIAGQTAPGDGINIRNAPIRFSSSHDIVVRGLRIRVGSDNGSEPCSQRKGISIGPQWSNDLSSGMPSYNIIIDKSSFSWTTDELFTVWGNAHSITLQRSILGEPLQNVTCPDGSKIDTHNYAIILGPCSNRISIHNNFISEARYRVPLIGGQGDPVAKCLMANNVEFINNIVYNGNWAAFTIMKNRLYEGSQAVSASIISNIYKDGKDSLTKQRFVVNVDETDPGTRLFIHDNLTNLRTGHHQDDWDVFVTTPTLATGLRVNVSPVDIPLFPIRPTPLINLDTQRLLAQAGATAPVRDRDDARMVSNYLTGQGGYVSVPPAGYPAYQQGEPSLDSDGDGIPDEWELRNGLDPANREDALRIDPITGYTFLENYLNSLFD